MLYFGEKSSYNPNLQCAVGNGFLPSKVVQSGFNNDTSLPANYANISSIFTTYTLQYIPGTKSTWLDAFFCNQTSRSFNQRDIGVKTNDWALRAFYCQPWILRSSSAFYCCQIHEPFQTRGLKIHSAFANENACNRYHLRFFQHLPHQSLG